VGVSVDVGASVGVTVGVSVGVSVGLCVGTVGVTVGASVGVPAASAGAAWPVSAGASTDSTAYAPPTVPSTTAAVPAATWKGDNFRIMTPEKVVIGGKCGHGWIAARYRPHVTGPAGHYTSRSDGAASGPAITRRRAVAAPVSELILPTSRLGCRSVCPGAQTYARGRAR